VPSPQLAVMGLFNKFGMHAQLLEYYNTHPTLFPKVRPSAAAAAAEVELGEWEELGAVAVAVFDF
jgi:hypothetical protein